MTNATSENPGPPANSRGDPRGRAVELYRTTNLSVKTIANDAGVSRDTVYRWLRKEGVSVGRNGKPEGADEPLGELARISTEIAELRHEQSVLIGRIARLEGLIESLIGLRHTVLGSDIT